jgi:L-iditol 2-dehydrogenase
LAGDIYNCGNGKSLGTINTWPYGSFAEYILMPERHMFHLDDRISFEQAALIEPATIGYAGLNAAGIKKGDSVLVTGTGAVGLSAVSIAKSLGAGKVIIAGRKQNKLDIGLKLGADASVNTAEEDMLQAVMRETGGKRVDKIIEASGSADLLDKALDCAGFKCCVVLLGFYEGKISENFIIDRIVLNNLNIKGVTGLPCIPRIIELMSSGAVDLTPLVTHIVPLEKGVEAFSEKSGDKIKILVRMTGE